MKYHQHDHAISSKHVPSHTRTKSIFHTHHIYGIKMHSINENNEITAIKPCQLSGTLQ